MKISNTKISNAKVGVLSHKSTGIYNPFKNHVDRIIAQNPTIGTISWDLAAPGLTGLPAGDYKWRPGTLVDDVIYAMPYSRKSILRIDTSTDSYTEILQADPNIVSSTIISQLLHPNGNIYGFSYVGDHALIFNPETNTTERIVNQVYPGSGQAHHTCCLAPNGMIYLMPFSGSILKFNPETKEFSYIGSSLGSNNATGSQLAKDGNIYTVPYTSTVVHKFEPKTETVSVLGTVPGWRGYAAALTPDGSKIIGGGWTEVNAIIINVDTQSVSFSNSVGTNHAIDFVLMPNGLMYAMPTNSNQNNIIYNTLTDTATTYPPVAAMSFLMHNKAIWQGFLAPNGNIYCIPSSDTIIYKATVSDINVNFDKEYLLSRYVNKR